MSDLNSDSSKDTASNSVEQSDEKRKAFGNRFLTSDEKVFEHNAWLE